MVVDLANVRPDHLRAEMGYGPDNRGLPTSFAYIDHFLADLASAAPGAVIIKIADYALRKSLSVEDQVELFRRASLPWDDADRIYLVRWADEVVLSAAAHYGAAVVSGDRYDDSDLAELKSPDIRFYRPKFSTSSNAFSFRSRLLRRDLPSWWSANLGDVDPRWFGSEEHADIAFNLRSMVHELTAAFHTDPSTYEIWTGGLAMPGASNTVPADEPQQPRPKKVYQKLSPWSAPVPVGPPPGAAVPVFFCDDDRELAQFVGRRVLMIGRISQRAGRTYMEWFPNDSRFEILGYAGAPSEGINDFTKVMVDVGRVNDALELTRVESYSPQKMTMAEVASARQSKRRERAPISPWNLPRSRDALVVLKRLHKRRFPPPPPPVYRWDEWGPRLIHGRFPAVVLQRWKTEDATWFSRWMDHEETRNRWESDAGFREQWLGDSAFRVFWKKHVFGVVTSVPDCSQCVLALAVSERAIGKGGRGCSSCIRDHGEESETLYRDWRRSIRHSREAEVRFRRRMLLLGLSVEGILFARWGVPQLGVDIILLNSWSR